MAWHVKNVTIVPGLPYDISNPRQAVVFEKRSLLCIIVNYE